ncbi:glycosyltransferase family 2 protein [Pedobacter montanisoli]|uniref:Glycosyltransferase family 2 protein n=1 Tax=Pedobacter montanisoli TaxID=2923277 RepID=A0ABS9ZY70_9SPHI|nr:glycosyltransferase family 2 protein [Pedobacter montanisoli]MCJ0743239.1 glycosyltransferase family 2 protein [Pedobacter montanisoli]
MDKLVSVVIPAYNEEENILVVIDHIEDVFEKLNYDYELIIVDDGCADRTLDLVREAAQKDSRVFYIELSRNFGHQPALKAGLDSARGDCVISLDADLQHPPRLLVEMLEKWEQGYDVVYTRRQEDKNLPFKKRKTSRLFYKLMNSLSDVELEPGTADFRLMDRSVINVFKDFKENDLFVRGMVKWLGFKQYALDYIPNARFAGSSKYNIKRMRKLAMQGVTSLSVKPLHMAVYLGFLISGLSLLYLPYAIYAYFHTHVSGWASLIVTIAFFGGLQLIILGILGIYIGKMFMQSKNRPTYIIRSTNIK